MKRTIFALFTTLLFASCEDSENEDVVSTPNLSGSIEIQVSIEHSTSGDILKQSKTVWYKGTPFRNVVTCDTIPSLGMTTEMAENEDGDEKAVTVQKNYEIYFTAK